MNPPNLPAPTSLREQIDNLVAAACLKQLANIKAISSTGDELDVDKAVDQIMSLITTHIEAAEDKAFKEGYVTAADDLAPITAKMVETAEIAILKKCRNAATQPEIKNDKFYFDIGWAVIEELQAQKAVLEKK